MFRTTAHVYDLVYRALGKDYGAESRQLRDLVAGRTPDARTLLDVACGTGGHLRHLREWFEVTGVDLDPAMLAEARAAVPDARLVEADMRAFDLGETYDCVVCLFSSIGYMATDDDLAAAISRMAAHLAPGGTLVVDGWIRPDAWLAGGSVHAVAANAPGLAVARTSRTWREGRRSVLEMHHLVATSDGVEHLVDRHELTLFTDADYRRAIGAANLTVERIDSPMAGRDRYVCHPAPHRKSGPKSPRGR